MAGVATDLVDRNSRGCIVEDEWEVGLKSRRGVAIPRLVSRDYGDSEETCSLAIGGFFLWLIGGVIACPSSMKLPTSPTRLTLGDVHYFDPLFFLLHRLLSPCPLVDGMV